MTLIRYRCRGCCKFDVLFISSQASLYSGTRKRPFLEESQQKSNQENILDEVNLIYHGLCWCGSDWLCTTTLDVAPKDDPLSQDGSVLEGYKAGGCLQFSPALVELVAAGGADRSVTTWPPNLTDSLPPYLTVALFCHSFSFVFRPFVSSPYMLRSRSECLWLSSIPSPKKIPVPFYLFQIRDCRARAIWTGVLSTEGIGRGERGA